jgi:hypothetical protein
MAALRSATVAPVRTEGSCWAAEAHRQRRQRLRQRHWRTSLHWPPVGVHASHSHPAVVSHLASKGAVVPPPSQRGQGARPSDGRRAQTKAMG